MSWSPNSKQLAFSLARPGWLEHLYILDVETKEIEILTELHKDFYPVWAPDGQRILFLRWNREFDTFCTIDIDTKTIEPLFDVDKATGYWGDWSPEGDSIAYSRWGSVYLYDFDTDETQEIVEVDGSIFIISWLRDGKILPVEPREKLVTTWSSIKRRTIDQ
jgi:Tol biopolymer transport system component